MNLPEEKRKIVESFVEECLKEYGRGRIGRIFATGLLIEALDQYAAKVREDVFTVLHKYAMKTKNTSELDLIEAMQKEILSKEL